MSFSPHINDRYYCTEKSREQKKYGAGGVGTVGVEKIWHCRVEVKSGWVYILWSCCWQKWYFIRFLAPFLLLLLYCYFIWKKLYVCDVICTCLYTKRERECSMMMCINGYLLWEFGNWIVKEKKKCVNGLTFFTNMVGHMYVRNEDIRLSGLLYFIKLFVQTSIYFFFVEFASVFVPHS